MNRLEAVVEQQPITIETQRVRLREGERAIPIPFTLFYQDRSLRETIHTEQTITPFQALTTLFHLIDAGRTDPSFRSMSRKKEKALKALLGKLYEPLWQAFSQDQQEALERQQAATRAAFAAAPRGDELVFMPGERVRFLGDGGGLRDENWIYGVVVQEVWRHRQFQGILVRRDKDRQEWTMDPRSLVKEYRWQR
jgi:hypothetical protein